MEKIISPLSPPLLNFRKSSIFEFEVGGTPLLKFGRTPFIEIGGTPFLIFGESLKDSPVPSRSLLKNESLQLHKVGLFRLLLGSGRSLLDRSLLNQ